MRWDFRSHGSSVLVASLSSAFGVTLLETTRVLSQAILGDEVTGDSGTVKTLLAIVAVIFMVVAIYVSTIVTANTFATIIAGRTRTIALLRLIGSSAGDQRRVVAREGLSVGVVGAVLGGVFGTFATMVMVVIGSSSHVIPPGAYSIVGPEIMLPMAAVALATWLASWLGSWRVLSVSPMEATGGAVEHSREESLKPRSRNAVAVVLFVLGVALLVLGILVGLVSPAGVLIGLVGGILSFTGLVLGAELIMPPALKLVGRMFGRSATARLASENAVRYPERSSRTTIGLVIGVTLVTMFTVAIASYRGIIDQAKAAQPQVYQGVDEMLAVTTLVLSVLVGFSALIAAIGMVNTLSMSVLKRTRELGLLRALGFTVRQIRRMILAESAQLAIAAVLVGLALGVFYGWAGAQSLLGSIDGTPGLVVPVVPLALLAIIAFATAILTFVASIAPSRRATRVAPVAALAVD